MYSYRYMRRTPEKGGLIYEQGVHSRDHRGSVDLVTLDVDRASKGFYWEG